MKKNLRLFIIPALIVLFVLTACNLPFKIGQKVNDNDADSTTSSSTEESSPLGGLFNGARTEAPTAAPTIDAKPVGIQEGLGSFDSYRLRVQVNSSDSDGKINNYAEYIERSVKDGATHSHMESTTFDPANDSKQNTSSTDIYEVGLITCQKSDSDDSWSYGEMTDDDKELTDIFKGMVDFMPVIANPTFAGADTANGIPSNHFTFQIGGIGAKSGAVATTNSGEYWLAQDGQYLVKYSLELEVHSADNSTWNKMEVLMDLTDVNSDVIDIEQPTDCVKTK